MVPAREAIASWDSFGVELKGTNKSKKFPCGKANMLLVLRKYLLHIITQDSCTDIAGEVRLMGKLW
jgi:hypothetical protein